MNPLRKNPKGRAVLGAMAWRLPEDDWVSPWSFESEWEVPPAPSPAPEQDAEAIRAAADPALRHAPLKTAEERLPQRTQADVLAEQRQVGAVFKFEDDEPFQGEIPLAAKPPQAAAFPPKQDSKNDRTGSRAPAPPQPAVAPRPETAPQAVATGPASSAKKSEEPAAPKAAHAAAPLPPPRSPAVLKEPAPLPEAASPQKTAVHNGPKPEINPIAATLSQAPQIVSSSKTVGATARGSPVSPLSPASSQAAPSRSAVSWGMLMAMAVLLFGFTLLAWQYLHEKPRQADDDLRPSLAADQTPVIQAPVKLRAFLDSVAGLNAADIPAGTPWTWDTPALSRHIAQNSTAIDNLRDLLEDYDWHPHHSDWHREDLSSHFAWSHAIRLLQAQTAYLARRGDESPAFAAAIDLAEMARRLQEVWAWPGYMHRSLEVNAAATESLAELLRQTRLSGPALAEFQNEFKQCLLEDHLLQQACAAYYVHEKKLLLGRASGELLDTMPGGQMHQRPGRLFFKTNETLADFASAFRELRGEITRPPYTRLSAGSIQSTSLKLKATRFYHPNAGGESYFNDHISPYLDLPAKLSLAKARHGLVMCLFAVRRHLAEQQQMPARLSDLVPASLDAVPTDPYSGEPFQYDPVKGLLYSVGVNLIAEGGRKGQVPLSDEREPTLELGISAAAIPGTR